MRFSPEAHPMNGCPDDRFLPSCRLALYQLQGSSASCSVRFPSTATRTGRQFPIRRL